MALKAPQIKVSKRMASLLLKTLNQRQLSGHYKKRMTIIRRGSLGDDNQDIAKDLQCSPVTVRKWRNKWKSEEESLIEFEKNINSFGFTNIDLYQLNYEMTHIIRIFCLWEE